MPSCLPSKNEEPVGDSVATGETSVRLGFIRKVYTVLTLQFLLTVGLCAVASFIVPVRDWVVLNGWIVFVGIGVALGCLIALYCFRTRYPFNALLLVLFTVGYGLMIASIVARYFDAGAGKIVFQAASLTAAVFVGLTLYAVVTRKDFSFMGGFLFAGLIVLIGASVINFGLGIVGARSRVFSFVISCIGALLMSGFILYDTSLVLNRYGPDQWIQGCISLYLDVANLFIYMLNIFSFAGGQ